MCTPVEATSAQKQTEKYVYILCGRGLEVDVKDCRLEGIGAVVEVGKAKTRIQRRDDNDDVLCKSIRWPLILECYRK